MTTIERIIALASGLGWQVTTQKKKRYLVEFEFQQYTKMGQDFNFCTVMKGNDINSLIENIEEYYEGFDPDYEAYLWIGTDGHGKNGAPYHIEDIVSEVETMIDKLCERLKTL